MAGAEAASSRISRERGKGPYRTVLSIPIHGNWKTLIRLHRGRSLVAVPIYLPEDPAIPAGEVSATSHFTRGFIADKRVLLREAKDVEAWVTYTASGVLMVIAVLWAATLGWGFHKLEAGSFPRGPSATRRRVLPQPQRL